MRIRKLIARFLNLDCGQAFRESERLRASAKRERDYISGLLDDRDVMLKSRDAQIAAMRKRLAEYDNFMAEDHTAFSAMREWKDKWIHKNVNERERLQDKLERNNIRLWPKGGVPLM